MNRMKLLTHVATSPVTARKLTLGCTLGCRVSGLPFLLLIDCTFAKRSVMSAASETEWTSLGIGHTEMTLDLTLPTGQSFRCAFRLIFRSFTLSIVPVDCP
eukprot:7472601-Pyramimonas_sp.AAC.2